MECEYCNLPFTSKYTLKVHLRTNKACLKKRGLELDTKFICIACKQICASNTNLSQHIDVCKAYICLKVQEEYDMKMKDLKINHAKELEDREKEIKDLKTNYAKEIEEMQYDHKKEITYKDDKIIDLQTQIDKMYSTIENLATKAIDKPTINNTTNNVRNNIYSDKYFLEKLTPEEITKKCRNHLTEEVFFEGQPGIAKMCTENIIKTKDEKVLLACTDVSRKKFKYIDEFGNIKEDYEARTFMEKVIGPIKKIGLEVYESIKSNIKGEEEELKNKRDCESMDRKTALHYKNDRASDCIKQILFIDVPAENTLFKNELAVLNKV
jgi:Zinc finger, C2H2 type